MWLSLGVYKEINEVKNMEFKINDIIIEFTNIENITEEIAKDYVNYANEHKTEDATIEKIVISKDGDEADIEIQYVQDKPKIERIRRITGYLTGALNVWNDAKRAEESERVKHV